MVPKKDFLACTRRLSGWRWCLHCATALLLTSAACTADRTPELFGTWQAELLIENGDTVDVDLNKVSLHFTPDLQYVYTSTLDYVEPGTFRLERGVLFTLPVGADASATRKVRIENLDSIYLFILMNDAGKLRQLQFRRLTASRPPVPVDEFNTPADSFAIDTTTYEYDSLELDGMDVDDHEEHDH